MRLPRPTTLARCTSTASISWAEGSRVNVQCDTTEYHHDSHQGRDRRLPRNHRKQVPLCESEHLERGEGRGDGGATTRGAPVQGLPPLPEQVPSPAGPAKLLWCGSSRFGPGFASRAPRPGCPHNSNPWVRSTRCRLRGWQVAVLPRARRRIRRHRNSEENQVGTVASGIGIRTELLCRGPVVGRH